MTRWMRQSRTNLAHEMLLGRPADDSSGWYLKRNYPERGSKRERVARIALARELRRGDEYFIKLVAAMIDPRTNSSIIKQKIEFETADKRREPKTSDRRDVEVAAFLHEWREQHPGEPVDDAIAAAEDHFGFGQRIIWSIWSRFKRKGT
jgi:hypothetical protein